MELGNRAGRLGPIKQDWSGRASRERLVVHVRPPTLEGHNFFVRIPIRVFLDFMKSPLSQDYSHISVDSIGYWSRPERGNRARLVG